MAREFASEKRSDTYAPATGCHTANFIPLIYLKMLGDEKRWLKPVSPTRRLWRPLT